MPERPAGTVAFLFTDLEGSTGLWERHPAAMPAAYARHDALLREAAAAHGGVVYKVIGDAFQVAFSTAPAAVAAALAAQRALTTAAWEIPAPVRVRMALHACEAAPEANGDYRTPGLNRLGRLLAAAHGGQVLLSATIAERAREVLPEEAGLLDLGEHRLRDLLLPERVFQLLAPGLLADFPPLAGLERHRHNLPAQSTRLIGREAEVGAVRTLLARDDVRLVTLTGPGGTGKTRLGLQVAAELVEEMTDGVWFVSLAAVADPARVIPTIAQALAVREAGGQPLAESLAAFLAPRETLLVLDNVEHLLAATPEIAALVAVCPRLKVLATSRAPLRVAGEREVPVSPLPLPAGGAPARGVGAETAGTGFLPASGGRLPPLEELVEIPGIRLFIERARAVKPDFAVTAATAAAVVGICRRLDGLPLAIELAAPRVRLLPPPALLERLEQRLPLLTGGARDLPARQRTLRDAIAWSHDLLAPAEQALFARLAVFVGGWTIAAAEALCCQGGDSSPGSGQSPHIEVLEGLDSLAEQSLVRQLERAAPRPDGALHAEPRLTMLETIREYAQERLEANGEAEALRRRHAAYYLALAERAEPELTGPQQAAWLDRLEVEHDNLRAALAELRRAGEAATQLQLTGSLWRFWWMHGHLSEGREWLEQTLQRAASAPPGSRAKALDGAGALAAAQGDHAAAAARHEAALGLWREIGDRHGTVRSLTSLGMVADDQGHSERATTFLEEALALAREVADRQGIAAALANLGVATLYRGDHERAAAQLEESLSLARELGDRHRLIGPLANLGMLAIFEGHYQRAAALYEEVLGLLQGLGDRQSVATALANLGHAVQQQGDLERASALYGEALDLFQELGDRGGTAFVLTHLGRLEQRRGDHVAAEARFRESLALGQQIGEQITVAEALEGMTGVALDRGEAVRGARLIGAAEALRETIGVPLPTMHQAEHERRVATVRALLGETALALARAEGQTLARRQAVAELAEAGAP